MKTKLLFSAICAAGLSGLAMADDDKAHVDLSSWDSDSDKIVTQEEWTDSIDANGLFERLDKNNNGNFDIEEASEGVIDYDLSMDIDAGGTISRDEFVVGLYDHYDENDDDKLDETEWNEFASVSGDAEIWVEVDEADASSDN